jgi:hypothetical protein
MRLKAHNPKIMASLSGELTITFDIDPSSKTTLRNAVDDLAGKVLSVEVKPWRERRSLDANAYLWKLCGELAEKLGVTKEDIYRRAVREKGVYDVYQVADEAVEMLTKAWAVNGVGWFIDVLDKALGFSTVAMYSGTSVYDKAQMSRVIEFIVEECKENGINTMTPAEEERLMSLWESRYCKASASV